MDMAMAWSFRYPNFLNFARTCNPLSLPWLLGWLCRCTCRTNAVQLVYLFLTVKILKCSNWGCYVWVLGQCFFSSRIIAKISTIFKYWLNWQREKKRGLFIWNRLQAKEMFFWRVSPHLWLLAALLRVPWNNVTNQPDTICRTSVVPVSVNSPAV